MYLNYLVLSVFEFIVYSNLNNNDLLTYYIRQIKWRVLYITFFLLILYPYAMECCSKISRWKKLFSTWNLFYWVVEIKINVLGINFEVIQGGFQYYKLYEKTTADLNNMHFFHIFYEIKEFLDRNFRYYSEKWNRKTIICTSWPAFCTSIYYENKEPTNLESATSTPPDYYPNKQGHRKVREKDFKSDKESRISSNLIPNLTRYLETMG